MAATGFNENVKPEYNQNVADNVNDTKMVGNAVRDAAARR